MSNGYRPKRLVSYVVASDNGLAPNVSGGICTLTVCKPLVRAVATIGSDLIVGVSTRAHGENRIIYAMQVDERIPLQDYFNDPRFQCKKPDVDIKGDNFFTANQDGFRIAFRNSAHFGKQDKINRDLRTPFAIVGQHFWYFGENAPSLPPNLSHTNIAVPGLSRRGHRINIDPDNIDTFMDFLCQYGTGVHGKPRDLSL